MNRPKIVLIEDHPLNRELVIDCLESVGYDVLAANTAATGIRMVEQEQPAIVLMDISLPDMDGLTATRRLKENPATRHIPVIAVTAHAMRSDAERIRDAGCDAQLTKPIDIRALRELVARLLHPGPPPQ